jgi:hypothetical protein
LKYFEAIKNLFPRSRAFELFVDNTKRKIMRAVSVLFEDIRHEAELVYMDLFPDTTRFPEKWEKTFAVYFPASELSIRRNILDSLWKINNGGQSAISLQDVLSAIQNIRVVENVPVTDPRNRQSTVMAVCDSDIMVCDNDMACCDFYLGDVSFEPGILKNDTAGIYSIPDDARYWQMCFFVCKEVYRNNRNEILYIEPISLPTNIRNFLEYSILRVKPVHSTAVMFVEWTEEGANDQS